MSGLSVKHVSIIDPGAFGVMMWNDVPFAVTLERTYLEGTTQVTKIPSGIYLCKKDFYHKGGYATFEIQVRGHDRILFHKANKEIQLDGCIAVGEEFAIVDGVPGILHCGNGGGFDEFWNKMKMFDSFDLAIE
jgi:Family of unknown function (DUF5675)